MIYKITILQHLVVTNIIKRKHTHAKLTMYITKKHEFIKSENIKT